MIAISGWLSQDTDKRHEWEHLKEYCKGSGAALFAYRWEARKAKNLAEGVSDKAVNFAKSAASNAMMAQARKGTKNMRQAVSVSKGIANALRIGPVDIVVGALGLTEVFMDQFKKGKNNAKVAGAILGYILAVRYPFLTQSVSLVGFSLGTQVIKSCLKTLHRLGAHSVIHNITFMAGAIDKMDRDKTKELWAEIFSTTVPGQIKNVYTKKDMILMMYSICETDASQGRNDVFKKQFIGDRRSNLLAEVE